jgi:hypothetical protein
MRQATLTDATNQTEKIPASEASFPRNAVENPAALNTANHEPFEHVEAPNQTYAIPIHDDWQFLGVIHDAEMKDHAMNWKGEHRVPGHDGVNECLLSIEYDPAKSEDFEFGYFVTIYLRAGNSIGQPRVNIGTYEMFDAALLNATAVLKSLPTLDTGDTVEIIEGTTGRYGAKRRALTVGE